MCGWHICVFVLRGLLEIFIKTQDLLYTPTINKEERRMKKKTRSEEELAPLEATFITGGIIVRATVKNFERVLELLREELPEVKLVYRKISLGNLYIREEKQSNAEAHKECAVAR